ncbi:MAG: CRISPR-associated endonuclease Cas2 [Candidatus Wildermuthbacteria bacterium RIFCSPHIGHO2_01_FULL_49_22b]|uniref:CRISPR-associated endonuclease Cas2 n=1 Tax=Candidatus Wildermuthbacteria bacterium RIFCSPHIGHO2_01_FULL_49_22b TaxID=1802448 RepID=A0A1G2QYX7_9BACT|nr:MAG: CRISPR-associated endonuclease Cas2 [Candidatus Wildermuthbacteria bacterium RIFCSPHIGHO2_01_FULL_49_22b]
MGRLRINVSKMRIPFTEQFLWDVYRAVEGLNDFHRVLAPRGMQEAVNPELRQFRREYEKRRSAQQFSKLVYDLKRRGVIKVQGEGVMLTSKGREEALRIRWKLAESQKRNDGKMVMVMYDLPEKQRQMRDIFRSVLASLGYQEFQKSIWVCKKKVERETEEAIREYNLWEYARLFIIKEIPV